VTESGSGDERSRPDYASEASGNDRADPSRREVQQAYRDAHRHRRLRHWSIGLASLLVVLLVLGIGAIAKLNGNITKVDVTKLLGKRPTDSAAVNQASNLKPLNILVMGSDTRELGSTKKFGKTPGVARIRPCSCIWPATGSQRSWSAFRVTP